MTDVVGTSPYRKEAADKITGRAKYAGDFAEPGLLHAKLLVSKHAHARILSVDASEAWQHAGVRAIVTGKDVPVLAGAHLEDRQFSRETRSDITVNRLRSLWRTPNTKRRRLVKTSK